ncbi:DUF4363 family protein [Clostridium paraputrificum]|uniref:DUF4363 family protein n=1 Tax=Clostridium TaxID=1485 RepID=UPI003D35092B
MRNTIISVVIFISLLGFVTYVNNSLMTLCDSIYIESEKIEALIDNSQWEDAYLITVDLIDNIKERDFIASVYLNHCDFDNLLNEALKLSLYVKSNDISESHVSVHLLKYSADNVKSLHKPTIENIF